MKINYNGTRGFRVGVVFPWSHYYFHQIGANELFSLKKQHQFLIATLIDKNGVTV